MIQVERVSPYGLDEHPDGTSWKNDEDGDLTVKDAAGEPVATYRDGYWSSVRKVGR